MPGLGGGADAGRSADGPPDGASEGAAVGPAGTAAVAELLATVREGGGSTLDWVVSRGDSVVGVASRSRGSTLDWVVSRGVDAVDADVAAVELGDSGVDVGAAAAGDASEREVEPGASVAFAALAVSAALVVPGASVAVSAVSEREGGAPAGAAVGVELLALGDSVGGAVPGD